MDRCQLLGVHSGKESDQFEAGDPDVPFLVLSKDKLRGLAARQTVAWRPPSSCPGSRIP